MVQPFDLCARLANGYRARLKMLPLPHTTQNLAILQILLQNGLVSQITRGTVNGADPVQWASAPERARRIWIGLKYRDDQPVLTHAEVISKPSKWQRVEVSDIRRLCSGKMSKFVKPLGLGEVAVVKHVDDRHHTHWLEAREALRQNVGGELLCRMR
ncbi:hypothetical protein FRB94_009325 [Tulasnella sp. JGI-2019a]|nr:hypothetical protein FRB93_008858 [Tulasnella sp. JGI-2019a]KAG8995250.1 hypothetical protein FRB94_009325 [Tulasnella sp. JGI-2019a]KAG9028448.1 hypothetical protein FRB95_006480 [Tulasnella sp. JGI-2019a]